jgi:hypothetical protein
MQEFDQTWKVPFVPSLVESPRDSNGNGEEPQSEFKQSQPANEEFKSESQDLPEPEQTKLRRKHRQRPQDLNLI